VGAGKGEEVGLKRTVVGNHGPTMIGLRRITTTLTLTFPHPLPQVEVEGAAEVLPNSRTPFHSSGVSSTVSGGSLTRRKVSLGVGWGLGGWAPHPGLSRDPKAPRLSGTLKPGRQSMDTLGGWMRTSCLGNLKVSKNVLYIEVYFLMSADTDIICPCTTRPTRYKKYSPDALKPPSSSCSPSLSLGTGISAHCSLFQLYSRWFAWLLFECSGVVCG
jgi:hypothetical protein